MGTTDITRHVNSLLANIIGKCRSACDFKHVRSRIFFPHCNFVICYIGLNLAEKLHVGKARIFVHLKKCLSDQFGTADSNVLYLRVNALSTRNNVIKNCIDTVFHAVHLKYIFSLMNR